MPSGLAALIVASVPLWMALLDGIHRRYRWRAHVVAGLLIGLAGILTLLVAPGRFAGNGSVDLLGAGALLLAALCWTTGSLYSRHARLPASVLTATAMQMIGGGVLLGLVGLAAGEGSRLDLAAVSPRSVLSLGYLVVFGSLLGFSAYVWLLRATTPARVSTYAYVNPVVGGFSGMGLCRRGGDPSRRARDDRGRRIRGAHHPLRRRAGKAGTRKRGRGMRKRKAARPEAEIAVLLHAMDEAYDRRAWHGTGLKGSLRGVTAREAAWRPAPGRHNIRELAVHAAYWKYRVRRRLTGEKRGSFIIEGNNWFERSGASEKSVALRAGSARARAPRSAPRRREPAARPPGWQARRDTPANRAERDTGSALHDVYHTGQIQLLKALRRRRRVA